ncbi:MAG: arginine repressor [Clostridia bacterium]|nr:arginine repressor [Clostridia bacterium]
MKKERHAEIIKIITENEIGTQEELLKKLEEAGYSTTQATVSRDIKDLGLVKQMNKNGIYCYAKSYADTEEFLSKFNAIFAHSMISADYAGNITVFKCYNGMAQAACAAFDNMKWEGLVGTLAGDDTFFALCRTEQLARELADTVTKLLK